MTEVQTDLHIDGELVAERVSEIQQQREVYVRTFAVADQQLDGRTLSVRVVPFGEVATVADPPDFRPYREEFVPGVFRDQQNAAHRVRLRSDHAAIDGQGQRKSGLAGVVGKGVTLTESSGGVDMEFRFLSDPESEKALELVREGGYDGVSAEFAPKRGGTRLTKEGVKQRTRAHLDSVALALGPAYTGAEILGLREAANDVINEELLPPPINKALLERCADLGIELPEGQALLLARAYSEAAWDGSASRWDTPEAYCAASAIDLNPAGAKKTKDRCHLPYKEPGSGTININGVRAALSRIGQGFPKDASQSQRDAARATLERILNAFNSSQG